MINPILASSARRRMRSLRTPIILTSYGLMIAVFAWAQTWSVNQRAIRLDSMRAGLDAYVFMLGLQFLLTILVTPALTAGSIAGERERQTLELIQVTNTGSLRIVFGKLLESFAFIALMIFTTLPMLFVTLMSGGVTVAQILVALLFMLVVAFGALSVGLLCSALFKRTVTATVVSYLVIFAIGIGTLLPAVYLLRARLGALDYDALSLMELARDDALRMLPAMLLINPAIGFLALMADQTMLLKSTFEQVLGVYQIYSLFEQVDFGLIAWLNMAVVAGLGLALTFFSALLVRPGRRTRVRKS